jgi:hypothetical protein
MNTWICYPVPLDNEAVEAEFLPYARRFVESWIQHPPGADFRLGVVCAHKEPSDAVLEIFRPLWPAYWRYDGEGADMGAAQFMARHAPESFIVAMTSRCYFHAGGWLERLTDTRKEFGPGLYGASGASREGGQNHLCLRCYGLDASIWNQYPKNLSTRDLGVEFEAHNGLVNFVREKGCQVRAVYWDSIDGPLTWHDPWDIFRKGTQRNLLVWDRHTDIYRDADQDKKVLLAEMARPKTVEAQGQPA